jgi:hypothetical protein
MTGTEAAFAPASPADGELAAVLAGVRPPLLSGEALCLKLGDLLRRAHVEFGQLLNSFNAMEASFSGREMEILSESIGALRRTITGLTSSLDAECSQITSLVGLGGGVADRLDRLRRSVRIITALAMNSRVEAARTDAQAGEVSGYTQELVELAARAYKAIDGCCREQVGLTEILNRAQDTLVDFRRLHGSQLEDVERNLGEVAGALHEHRARVRDTVTTLLVRTKDITSEIGAIVMALQIGDSTRQRVEHVLESIAELGTLYANSSDARPATELACRLGALQIEGAREDLEVAFGEIGQALSNLAGQAEDIAGMAQQVGSSDRQQSRGFVSAIRSKLGAALELSQQAGAARTKVDVAVGGIVQSTARVDEQMQVLSEVTCTMSMIGINAVLRARRVGTAGLGLGVIADQLQDTADTVVSDLDIVTPALRDVVAATQNLATMLAARRGDLADSGGETANAALSSFSAFGSEMERILQVLVERGGDPARDLNAASQKPAADESLQRMVQLIERLEDLANEDAGAGADAAMIEMLDATFAKRYSMAAERDIHDAFCTSAGERTNDPRIAA